MAISEARKRANKKWNDANMSNRYDRIQIVVPKGMREALQGYAKAKGYDSLNAYTKALYEADSGLPMGIGKDSK